MRGKLNPRIAMFGHKIPRADLKAVQAIYDKVEGREQRFELNLYIAGEDEERRRSDGAARRRRGDAAAVGRQGAERGRRDSSPQAGGSEVDRRRRPRCATTDTGSRGAMKVAYWPGCVSRGFTPELHGSMAQVAPLLDIELVELDRACCTGAGVIAEHNQELADTLNARTFALAQQVDGAELMMNICSTCQGAQSECQERLDASSEYRDADQRDARRPRA